MKYTLFFAFVLLAFPACTRKVENKPLTNSATVFGPINQDVSLALTPRPLLERQQDLVVKGTLNTADYLRFSEDLLEIGNAQSSTPLQNFSRSLLEKYREQTVTKTSLANSLYTQTIIGEGEPAAQKELDFLAKALHFAVNALSGLLDQSKKSFPWPRPLQNFSHAVSAADAYAAWILEKISTLGLEKEIARQTQTALATEYGKFRPELVFHAQAIEGSTSLGNAIHALKNALAAFKVSLSREQQAEMQKAEVLVQLLAEVESSREAFTMIIYVWRMVAPEKRKEIFYSFSPELYDFLADKSESSLDCMQKVICPNPLLEVPRRVFIFPKLENYGIARIRDAVDSGARSYLLQSVLKAADGFLLEIPDFIKTEIVKEAHKYKTLIANVQQNFPGFVYKKMQGWQLENFPRTLRGLEPKNVRVAIENGKAKISFPQTRDLIETSGEALGTSLATAHYFLPENSQSSLRAALVEPLVKLLAIGGFRQADGTTFPSLLFPLDGKRNEVFQMKNFLQGSTSFAVPDSFVASSDRLVLQRKKQQANSSVKTQAELLRGISRQIRFHRDWEKNTFDETLGKIQMEELVQEIPPGSINYSLFPKPMVLALSVGGAGAILQNIIKNLSPAFLLLPNGELLWGNDYQKIGEGKISTVAGLVDIVDGARGKTVKTADIAYYILALHEFLKATEGIEQTKALPLLEKDADGRTVLDQLLEARRYLRLFQLGLTNFLVYVAQAEDGGFRHSLHLGEKVVVESDARLLTDQALAIRALLATADQLGLSLFSWAALDGYYFMNQKLWREDTQFYASFLGEQGRAGRPNALEMATTLRALEELSPFMPATSRSQWEAVAKPWIEAWEGF